jgi:hypothetical protein
MAGNRTAAGMADGGKVVRKKTGTRLFGRLAERALVVLAVAGVTRAIRLLVCQSAWKPDPLSAPNVDPCLGH